MDKGLKFTEKERAKFIERVNEILNTSRIIGPKADLLRVSYTVQSILDKKITSIIDRINNLSYVDKLEENTERMVKYLLILYNVYYKMYVESIPGEYISAFKFFNRDIQEECVKSQLIIENMIKNNIKGDIYTGSTSKWTELIEELDDYINNIYINRLTKEEINKKAEDVKNILRGQGCSELDIRDYNRDDIKTFNACGFSNVQPVFKVIEYYYELLKAGEKC